MCYSLFKDIRVKTIPEITLSRSTENKSIVYIQIGKHEQRFEYFEIVKLLQSIGAVQKDGQVNMERVQDKLIYFVNELVKLEQYTPIIN